MSPYINRSLSYPSRKSVIIRLDANIRFHLSLKYPSIRRIEKLLPLKIKNLQICTTILQVNNISYEIVEDEKIGDLERYNQTLRRESLQWRSDPGEVPILGDIDVPRHQFEDLYCPLRKRGEVINGLREKFYRDTDEYLTGVTGTTNPLECFNPRRNGTSPRDADIIRLLQFGNHHDESAPHPLALKYPLAYRKLLAVCAPLEEFIRTERNNLIQQFLLGALQRIIYPQTTGEIYNEFNIRKPLGNQYLYSCRLPERISPRWAFKKMTTQFLGGREKAKIHIDNLEFNVSTGLVGLPVGLKLSYTNLQLSTLAPEILFHTIEPLVEKRVSVKEIYVKVFPRDINFFQMEQIRRFSRLHVKHVSVAIGNDLPELGNLHFHSIRIDYINKRVGKNQVRALVDRWCRRDDLHEGMSFQIGLRSKNEMEQLIEHFYVRIRHVPGVLRKSDGVAVPHGDSTEIVLEGQEALNLEREFIYKIGMKVNAKGTAQIEWQSRKCNNNDNN